MFVGVSKGETSSTHLCDRTLVLRRFSAVGAAVAAPAVVAGGVLRDDVDVRPLVREEVVEDLPPLIDCCEIIPRSVIVSMISCESTC